MKVLYFKRGALKFHIDKTMNIKKNKQKNNMNFQM